MSCPGMSYLHSRTLPCPSSLTLPHYYIISCLGLGSVLGTTQPSHAWPCPALPWVFNWSAVPYPTLFCHTLDFFAMSLFLSCHGPCPLLLGCLSKITLPSHTILYHIFILPWITFFPHLPYLGPTVSNPELCCSTLPYHYHMPCFWALSWTFPCPGHTLSNLPLALQSVLLSFLPCLVLSFLPYYDQSLNLDSQSLDCPIGCTLDCFPVTRAPHFLAYPYITQPYSALGPDPTYPTYPALFCLGCFQLQ